MMNTSSDTAPGALVAYSASEESIKPKTLTERERLEVAVAALEVIERALEKGIYDPENALGVARDAIAKARGGMPRKRPGIVAKLLRAIGF